MSSVSLASSNAETVASLAGADDDAQPAIEPLQSIELSSLPKLQIGEDAEFVTRGELGSGAMGRVLLVEQRSIGRNVAMKTLRDDNPSKVALRSLLTEAAILGKLEHPNMVPLHQLGLDARGLPAFIAKRISGVAWSQLLAEPNSHQLKYFMRSAGDVLDAHLEILMRICDVVHYANQRGVIHRDIKPENVMVGDQGEVYLVDWGIAATIGDPSLNKNVIVGTPGYMAPEMVTGGELDSRSDVYLLGATLHFILTGTVRHKGDTAGAILIAASISDPITYDPDTPDELAQLAARATHRIPSERPANAAEFRDAIIAWRHHQAANRLYRASTIRLARMQGLRAAGNATPREFMRLATECRFGFAQALIEWPEYRLAREGLRNCVKEMIGWAIEHEDATTAKSLLDELVPPSRSLTAKYHALLEKKEKQKAQVAHAANVAREQDLNVAGQDRLRLLVFIVVLLSTVRLGLIAARGSEKASEPVTLLAVGALACVVFTVGIYISRRELFQNTVNRQVVGVLFIMLVGIFANRVHGYAMHIDGTTIMGVDSLVAAVTGTLAAITIRKQLIWSGAINLVGAVISTLKPAWAAYSFSLSSIAGLIVVAYVLDRYKEQPSLEPAKTPTVS